MADTEGEEKEKGEKEGPSVGNLLFVREKPPKSDADQH